MTASRKKRPSERAAPGSTRGAAKRRKKAAPRRADRVAATPLELLTHVATEWRTTVDTAREVIVMVGPDARIVRANVATQELFGKPFSELVGAPANEVARPLLGAADPLRLARARKARRPFRGEIRSPKGRWFALAVDPIPAARGKWNGAVCRLRDVTDRKRADLSLRRSLRRLRDLAAHLQDSHEQERSLIAREIHDQLAHDLTALKLDLVWLRRQLDESHPDLRHRIEAMTELLARSLKSLRRISSELRNDLLEHFGPAAAIEWLAEEFRLSSGVATKIDLHHGRLDLSSQISTALFRILQEALSNVARHAQASRVAITLRRRGARVELQVTDDGIGFDPDLVVGHAFGLLGTKERVESLGGDFAITSRPSCGATVTASLPLG